MWIEQLSYIATFIISAGLAVIGILISYQIYQTHKKPVFQILLYQQIFLFSFFIYGIWGNLVIREIISDFNLSEELSNKLAVFIPVLGIPFLIISWFMLMKFSFNLNGVKISKGLIYSYFPMKQRAVSLLTPRCSAISSTESQRSIITSLSIFSNHTQYFSPMINSERI